MAVPYSSERHDFGILRQDGTSKVGMMLVQKNGTPVWEEYDDDYLAEQKTESPGYDNLPVEKELAIIGDDWRSGFGLETYDANDSKRYFSSYNADLRFKGTAILGPVVYAATFPSIPAMTDVGLEDWTDATHINAANWTYSTNGTSTQAREGTIIDTGSTYSAKITVQNAAGSYGQFLQAATNYASLKGATISVTCRVYNFAVANAKGQLIIDDGDGAVTTASSVGETAFETVRCTRKISASATKVEIILKGTFVAGAAAVYFDNVVFSTVGSYASWAEFDDDLLLSSGGFLFRVNNSTGDITIQGGFPAAITCLQPFSDNNLYIALGYSDTYWYMNTSEVFTLSTAAVNTFQYFCFVRTTADTMYGSDSVNTIRSTTNPQNAGVAWSAVTTIDSSYKSITGLLSFDNALYILKEDRPYYLNSAGAVKVLTNSTTAITSSNGGKNAYEWMANIYFPWGYDGLLEYDSQNGTFEWLNPAHYGTNLGDFDGQVMAVAGDEEYLYIGVDNGTKVEIIAGRRESIDGTTSWVWHPLSEKTLVGIEAMKISSVYSKRLWIGSTSATNALYYIKLPLNYGDVPNDTNANAFQTGGYFITPWYHANFKGDTKAWIKITATVENTTAAIYWSASYQKLGDTDWTAIGDFTTEPTTTKYIPATGAGVKPVSKAMRFKFTATTNAATTTPILYNFDIRAILYPSQRNLIYCQVKAADEMIDKTGKSLDADMATMKAVIDEAKAATWAVTIYDINGDTKTVKFLPLPKTMPKRVLKNAEKGRVKEWGYNVLMQEVTLS